MQVRAVLANAYGSQCAVWSSGVGPWSSTPEIWVLLLTLLCVSLERHPLCAFFSLPILCPSCLVQLVILQGWDSLWVRMCTAPSTLWRLDFIWGLGALPQWILFKMFVKGAWIWDEVRYAQGFTEVLWFNLHEPDSILFSFFILHLTILLRLAWSACSFSIWPGFWCEV